MVLIYINFLFYFQVVFIRFALQVVASVCGWIDLFHDGCWKSTLRNGILVGISFPHLLL